MKVRISVGQKPISSYLNIDPSPNIEKDKIGQFDCYLCDIRNISELVEEAGCEELLVETLDYIRSGEIIEVIQHWISRLRHKGKIIIKGTNLESAVKKFLNGEITTLDLNILLFGEGNHPWSYKNGCINLEEVDEILRKGGLKIVSKQIIGTEFIIAAQRP